MIDIITPYRRAEDRAPRRLRQPAERRSRVALHAAHAPTATGAPSPGARSPRRSDEVALFLGAAGLARGDRACHLRAQPRRVDERGARHPGRRRRDGARLRRRARRSRRRTSSQHSDAKVVFVDTPRAARRACFEAWDAYAARRRASCCSTTRSTSAAVLDRAPRRGQEGARRTRRSSASSCPGRARSRVGARARPRGAGRVRADDERRLARSAGDDALHERHLGQPQGRAAHAPQRGASTGSTGCAATRPCSTRATVDLLWLPMSHIFGFGEACLGNTLGFTTLHGRSARACSTQLPEVRPSVFMSVP